jgi:hypothetical protein
MDEPDNPPGRDDNAEHAAVETTSDSPTPPATEPPPDDDQSAAGPGAQKPKAKPKAKPVLSLVDMYTVPGANPGKLLRELVKTTSWKFDDQDVDAALALLDERDPHLERTRRLVHMSIQEHESRFARTAIDFAIRAADRELQPLASWPPGDDADPVSCLRELGEHLRPSLSNPKEQKRAHNVLMMGVDTLSNRAGLAFEAAAPVLREIVGRPPEYGERRSNPRRHRIASVTLPRNDLERVRDLLDLLEPWEREGAELRQAEQRAATESSQALRRASDAETALKQLQDRFEDIQRQLADARQESVAAHDQARDMRVVASADVTELRSRVLAFLNTRLRDLLATAKEASEVDPPRAATAVRLLDQAIAELGREVEWLRSSV